jgi:type I restriction enzyme S subunit
VQLADHPQDWKRVTLGELLDFSNGVNADKSAYGSGLPFVNVSEIIAQEALTQGLIPGRMSLPASLVARYLVRRGDILFNRSSETADEVGIASVYLDDAPAVFGGFVFRGRLRTADLQPRFAAYLLRSAVVRQQITVAGQGGIRSNIGQRDLKKVVVALPGHAEQEAIVEVMDDATEQVAAILALIAKKQDIKHGLEQALLSGRTRLQQFASEWVETTAGMVGSFRGGSGFPLAFQGATAGAYPFFKVSDMNHPGNELFMAAARHYISEPVRKQLGAVVFAADTIVFAKVGAAIFLERKRILKQDSCIDNNMAGFTVSPGFDVRYMHYALCSVRFGSLVSTTALPSLNGRQLSAIPLCLPPDREEQRAIAGVLADADAELHALRTRLAKARDIKQGLAQQLLTGRTRLPVSERLAVEMAS